VTTAYASTLPPLLRNAFPPSGLGPGEEAWIARLQPTLDAEIAPAAAANDARGRYPTESVAALKRTGILQTSVPACLGGPGFGLRFSAEVQARIAVADPAVAQLFKIHDEVTREILVYGPEPFRRAVARRLLEEDIILGLAVAESGRKVDDPMTTTARPLPDGGFEINGRKIYTTGAAEADLIAVWAFNPDAPGVASDPLRGVQLNLVPRDAAGIEIHRDWNALGQRATDSGTVTFRNVRTDPTLRANDPGGAPLPTASLGYQVGFAAILIGVAVGGLKAAVPFVNGTSRPWPSAGVDSAADDPYVRRLAGELAADLAAAYALTLDAADLVDAAAAGAIPRAAAAGPVYAAKSTASRAAIRATMELCALLGTRSAIGGQGFDRYWRDARTLALHDPVDWKNAELGRIVLGGWDPPPGVYQ